MNAAGCLVMTAPPSRHRRRLTSLLERRILAQAMELDDASLKGAVAARQRAADAPGL
jgi:hypothetical protein